MAKSKVLENLAHMKFMIRANNKVEEVVVKEGMVDEEHWRLDVPDLPEIKSRFTNASHSDIERLGFGRFSFKNFNPLVEKLRRKFDGEELDDECGDNEKMDTVTEEEMAKRYSSLVGTLGRKLKTKKRRLETKTDKSTTLKDTTLAKKAKFKKPQY